MADELESRLRRLLVSLVATEPSPGLVERVRGRVRGSPTKLNWRPFAAAAGTAVIVAAALAGSSQLFRTTPPTPNQPHGALYPSPHKPTGPGSIPFPAGAPFTCPSLAGVSPAIGDPSAAVWATFNAMVTARSELADLKLADRAAWPVVRANRWWQQKSGRPYPMSAVAVAPAVTSPYSPPLESLCGRRTVSASWALSTCSPTIAIAQCVTRHPAVEGTYFFLRRDSTWLLWAEYP